MYGAVELVALADALDLELVARRAERAAGLPSAARCAGVGHGPQGDQKM
jgi:hypothetical protein